MPPLSLEERVAVLEQELSDLKSRQGREKDWRRTIGMFTDNPEMKELFTEAMKLREADRRSFLSFLDELDARPVKPGPSVGPLNREELYDRGDVA
jgi:hypothetical protein